MNSLHVIIAVGVSVLTSVCSAGDTPQTKALRSQVRKWYAENKDWAKKIIPDTSVVDEGDCDGLESIYRKAGKAFLIAEERSCDGAEFSEELHLRDGKVFFVYYWENRALAMDRQTGREEGWEVTERRFYLDNEKVFSVWESKTRPASSEGPALNYQNREIKETLNLAQESRGLVALKLEYLQPH